MKVRTALGVVANFSWQSLVFQSNQETYGTLIQSLGYLSVHVRLGELREVQQVEQIVMNTHIFVPTICLQAKTDLSINNYLSGLTNFF